MNNILKGNKLVSKEQLESLVRDDSITVNEQVYTFDDNTVYMTPEEIDSTLSKHGVAADAKAVGEAIAKVDEKIGSFDEGVVDGSLSITGALNLPNSPQTPDTSEIVTTKLINVETADKTNTGLTVVDGSNAIVTKIQGDTIFNDMLEWKINTEAIDLDTADFGAFILDGITVTYEANYIILNGTSEASGTSWYCGELFDFIYNSTYYVDCIIENAPNGFQLEIVGMSGYSISIHSGETKTINTSYSDPYYTVHLKYTAGMTFNNTRIKVALK